VAAQTNITAKKTGSFMGRIVLSGLLGVKDTVEGVHRGLSFIKSPFSPGCRAEIREVHATTTAPDPRASSHLEFGNHHNVSEKSDWVARRETVCDRHLRCRCPSVPVMQTADSLLCPQGTNFIRPRFGRPSARRLLIESDMSSVLVIIANIFEAEP